METAISLHTDVRINGSRDVEFRQIGWWGVWESGCPSKIAPTDNKTREKCIDPPHDQSLWHHHSKVSLHHAHHALHGRRIRHGVRSGFASGIGVGQKLSLLVCRHHVCFSCLKGCRRQHVGVCAQVDAAHERALLAELRKCLFLGRALEKDHGIVAEDTG